MYPTDIIHQEFSGTLFGFSKKEVREFLEQLATELEDYQRRQEKEIQRREVMQHEVKQEAIQASSAVEDLKRREELISRTLVFAEKTKADIIANARKEAENIIHEAELKAKRAIQEARQLVRVKIMPTERSMPAVITTSAWAMATKASSTPLLEAVCTTLALNPAGWFDE